MFTGLIEEIGVIGAVSKKTESMELYIKCSTILSGLAIGDSIAVNGVCLTVTTYTPSSFTADVMPETFHATSLKVLPLGSKVNLERAMKANGRFGGHFVSGHVDTTGVIKRKEYIENALYLNIHLPKEFMQYMMEKGSIAIDGTSLTIFSVNDQESCVTISLIPQTQKDTSLSSKKKNDVVNIECDMIAKYLNRLLKKENGSSTSNSSINVQFLKQHGFTE
ncbi:riboflavin synthase [Bacillus sp. 2205SS5-2]|uniref:riboflavin synthase n=1 Tax=Bacillus sp. 2205SS5-2 TaxID=3109031 RepID=UPI003003CFEB